MNNQQIIKTLKVGDTIRWNNGPIRFKEKVRLGRDGRTLVVSSAVSYGTEIPLTALRLPIEKVKNTALKEAVDAEGKTLKVGDSVEFKSDIEQWGVISKINGRTVTIVPPKGGKFYGEYIGGDKSTIETSDRVYKMTD